MRCLSIDDPERVAGLTRVSEDLVLVLTASSVPEGEIARSLLEEEGIPVLIQGTEGPYPVGPIELLVAAEHEERARRVLDQVQRGEAASGGAGDED
jgi:hypothetical protein